VPAGDRDVDGAVVGQHRFATGAIAVIRRLVRLGRAGRIPQVMAELGTEGALNQGFELPRGRLHLKRR
jgi:hypothetical protein